MKEATRPILAVTGLKREAAILAGPGVEVVVGGDDRAAPAEDNATWIRENVRGARETILPGVGHTTFLDVCTAQGAQTAPKDCEESPGVDRAAVHANVTAMAVSFFDRSLHLR